MAILKSEYLACMSLGKHLDLETRDRQLSQHYLDATIAQAKLFFNHYSLKLILFPNFLLTGFEANANSEMEHLFAETDANKDGKLSKKEILEQHDLWVGSHATDYGRHLDTIKTEL
ncbi:unnamed protein product [Protopolystoma xenopodis]|uniref:EF-hand domain-containing protein n=1 Tax=Protopolystoma xenopodis TaxID=117903 RepID=A0A3S5APY4_9PLAT|nr:unnamed protein product [Protopolystoma xenopodis]